MPEQRRLLLRTGERNPERVGIADTLLTIFLVPLLYPYFETETAQ